MTTERLWDRPRIILPGPSGGVLIGPGCTEVVKLFPVILMQAPWWVGMIAFEELHVKDICFGDESGFSAPGMVPSYCFDVRKLECLVPFQAKAVGPGRLVTIEIHNWSCATVQTTLVVWGSPTSSPSSKNDRPTEMDLEASRRGLRLAKDGYWK